MEHLSAFSDATEEPSGVGDYVAVSGTGLSAQHDHPSVVDFANAHPSYEFMCAIGEVVNVLVSAGLAIDRLNEYPYANCWKGFDGMPSLPLMYAIAAHREAA
ncbi:hypothetical protein [Burkholderia cepacia]|uniref:hypothetical protein n=1 Tax=Burkholderia cepacia TaxID=292 RepID=UPI002ABDB64D|nr:hypothetical protein [Burkholderia cepacia]